MKKKDKILIHILKILEKRGSVDNTKDILSYNFIDNGHIDSLNSIKFILELQSKFKLKFSDKEINSKDFKKVGGLLKIIKRKIKKINYD